MQYFLEGLTIKEGQDNGLPSEMGELFLLVHPDQQRLQALLNKALAAIPSEAHAQLSKKWLEDHQAFSRFSGTVPYPALLQTDNELRNVSLPSHSLKEFQENNSHYYLFSRPFETGTNLTFSAVAPAW